MAFAVNRAGYTQIRWRHREIENYNWQQFKVFHLDHVKAALGWLKDRDDKIADSDPLITGGAWLRGSDAALRLVVEQDTFVTVAQDWLATKITVKAGTRSALATMVNKHFARWHSTPVADFTPGHLNDLYRHLITAIDPQYGKALKVSTAEGVMARACEILAFAWGRNATYPNPRQWRAGKRLVFRTPRLRKVDNRNCLTDEQIAALIEELPTERDRAMVELFVHTGLRIGEICALAAGDFDASKGLLYINAHMVGARREPGTKGNRGDTEKIEFIYLAGDALEIITTWCAGKRAGEPIFPYVPSRNGRRTTRVFLESAAWRRDVFNPAARRCAEAGVMRAGVTPHWLRHTACSRHLATMSLKAVQETMRHRDPRMLGAYDHHDAALVEQIRNGMQTSGSRLRAAAA